MQTHSLPQTIQLPSTQQAIADARLIVCTPELAVLVPQTFRLLALKILASQQGFTVVQRHRPANSASPRT
ncbi:hypothetical protein RGQ15_13710 [Paracoccus sp. MBLB3053]|uniref:Uncharacterized protein n=1 Tax=Paracoccus aurantius TaxID=3073814 RepID=A0ABU2HUA4_9RHOB|nr:hypothetical protein [Paracoccus sp. MBLB3053]MDS9468621.1 hypothetical protein [Paracoccus sp. MBLB3053]